MATVRELKARFSAETKGIKAAFKQVQQEAAKLSGTTKKTTNDVNKHYNSLTQSTDKLKQALEETNNVDAFSELTEASERAQEELRETGKVSEQTMSDMESAVEEAARRFNSLGPDARSSFDVVGRAIEDVNGDLVSLRNTAGRSLETLNDAQADAAQGFENLGQSAGRMKDSIQAAGQTDTFSELTEAADKAQREIEETGSVTTTTMQELRTAVDGSSSHFNSMSTEARSSLSEIENAINWVNDDLGRLELSSRNSLNGLSEASQNARQDLNRVGDQVGDLDADLRNLGDDNGLQNVEEDAGSLGDTLGGLGGAGGIIAGVGGAFVAASAGVLGFVAAGVGIFGFIKSSDELKQSVNGLQAQTGATTEEIDGMRDSLVNIYGNNFGEGFEDIADSLAIVTQQTNLSGEALEEMTTNALLLRDTFEYDVAESTKAASTLMKQFGIDGAAAQALIADGTQNGLNYADDLLDTIGEYSVYYEQAGFSAEEMFGMFKNAQETGAFNLDYAADAFKEFGIIMTEEGDGATDVLSSIGLPAKQLQKDFAAGGETARAAFETIATKLGSIKDPLDRQAAGVALFGTKFEDLGADAVIAMAKTNDSIQGGKEVLDSINEVKYDTIGEAIAGVGRKAVANILIPIQDKVMPGVNGAINGTIATISTMTEAMGAFIRGDETAEDVLMSYGLDPKEFQGLIDAINSFLAIANLGSSLPIEG